MIKYTHAYNEEDEIIDVKSLNRDMHLGKFHCIGCEKELIPRLGEKRQKHFAHKVDQNCSPETYLHRLAKNIFYDLYKDCLENQEKFILEYADQHYCNHFEDNLGIKCNLGRKTKEFDLVSYYDDIKMEKRDGSLIPDIRIINTKKDKSLYIEMAVTHEVEDEKQASGKKIIEFLINDESDLELIEKKRISLHDERINRFNFKEKITKIDRCKGECKESRSVFIVYKSGKAILTDKMFRSLNALIKKGNVADFRFAEDFGNYSFREFAFVQNVIKSHENGVKVKNCFLCRYHARNSSPYSTESENIFCKFLKESCKSNYAADCEYFRPDKDVYAEYLEGF